MTPAANNSACMKSMCPSLTRFCKATGYLMKHLNGTPQLRSFAACLLTVSLWSYWRQASTHQRQVGRNSGLHHPAASFEHLALPDCWSTHYVQAAKQTSQYSATGIPSECFGCRPGPVDKISSWLGRLPGTSSGVTY